MRVLFTAMLVSSFAVAGCSKSTASAAAPETTTPPSAHHLAVDTAKPSPVAVAASDAAVAPAASESPASDREAARYRDVTIPANTQLTMTLSTGVSSKTSSVEDSVNATLRRAVVINGVAVLPAGSAVSGFVTEAERSGRVKGRARIGVRFTSVRAHDTRYDIRTAAISREAPGTKKKDAVKIGAGAGAGALIGAIAGGKKGAAIGSAVGAGGGTGVVLATRGEEVSLVRGTIVSTRLTAPLTVRVRIP
jgi:hypothetical protein